MSRLPAPAAPAATATAYAAAAAAENAAHLEPSNNIRTDGLLACARSDAMPYVACIP